MAKKPRGKTVKTVALPTRNTIYIVGVVTLIALLGMLFLISRPAISVRPEVMAAVSEVVENLPLEIPESPCIKWTGKWRFSPDIYGGYATIAIGMPIYNQECLNMVEIREILIDSHIVDPELAKAIMLKEHKFLLAWEVVRGLPDLPSVSDSERMTLADGVAVALLDEHNQRILLRNSSLQPTSVDFASKRFGCANILWVNEIAKLGMLREKSIHNVIKELGC